MERFTRYFFLKFTLFVVVISIFAGYHNAYTLWALVLLGPIILIGFVDILQKRHAILRNFPFTAHFRFLLEEVRPELRQYFMESDMDGSPYTRESRSLIYQRAKKEQDTIAFGSRLDHTAIGHEWVNHSMMPTTIDLESMRITIGGAACKQPYSSSIFNISAMSFGSLSGNAVLALNGGAQLGGFSQNTGEGGLTSYHLENGGDLVWQLGTGYFGCRTKDGHFDPQAFQEKALHYNVKMIEIKISQGAKPGHGGILPAKKVSREIAKFRDVPVGKDVISPCAHSAFDTPTTLIEFVEQLRELSDGKPIGFKLCIGKRREFLAICKAMLEKQSYPDYIVVDGSEGGTGAAPLEFANTVGCPSKEALIFVHNALTGFGIRKQIKLISSAKVSTGFDLISSIALGADACNAARSFMMSIGCIHALKCNQNTCPVGIATQNKELSYGLDVADKKVRCANYHRSTVQSAAEILAAMGLKGPEELRPWHIMRRTKHAKIQHYGEIYPYLNDGDLLNEDSLPAHYARAMKLCSSNSFRSHHSP